MPKRGSSPRREPQHAWIVSLASWLLLFAAAGLYAAVSLSPRFLEYLRFKNEYYVNQVRLVGMERQIGYLNRVADALENDPEFAAELARIDFDALGPGEEHISVSPDLTLDARRPDDPPLTPATSLPWYAGPITVFAENPRVRTTSLITAVILIVVAFTFLQEPADQEPRLGNARNAFRTNFLAAVATRYRKDN